MPLNKVIAKSKTTEVYSVLNETILAYEKKNFSEDPYITSLFTRFTPLAEQLSSAINRISAESSLEEKDELRDNHIRGIFYLIKGNLFHPSAGVKEAAQTVMTVFDQYGLEMMNESYAIESALITSLLEQLNSDTYEPAVAKLPGLSQIIGELTAMQDDFEAARVAYETEKAAESTLPTATELKREILDIYNNKLVIYLRAMSLANEPLFGEFSRTLAGIINKSNEQVKKRTK